MDTEPGRDDQKDTSESKKQEALSVGKAREEAKKAASSSGAENANSHQEPTHSLKILLRGHSMLEWISLGFTLVLVLVGIFYTFYAAKQWQAMQAALKKTDQSLELTRQSLELNRRQTVAAEESAKAASESVRLGKSSLDTSTKSFQIEQRPYLITAGAPRFVGDARPAADHPIHVNITFLNVGKTPAIRVQAFRHLAILPGQSNMVAVSAFIERFFADARQTKDDGQGEDVAPGGTFFTTGQDIPILSAEEIAAIEQSRDAIYFIGGASYEDAFRSRHKTEFCFSFIGTDITVWHICGTHNTVR